MPIQCKSLVLANPIKIAEDPQSLHGYIPSTFVTLGTHHHRDLLDTLHTRNKEWNVTAKYSTSQTKQHVVI